MLKRIAILILMLLIGCSAAFASQTADLQTYVASGEFPEYEFEPVVLYEFSHEGAVYAIIRVMDIDEEYIHLSAENLSNSNLSIHLENYHLDDLQIGQYTEWSLPASATSELTLEMPEYFKWLGPRKIGEFGVDDLAFNEMGSKHSRTLNSGIKASVRISDTDAGSAGMDAGCILASDYWGSVTLLGIDYPQYDYPHAVFLVKNAMPLWYRDPKHVVVDYSQLSVSTRITSINGYPYDRTTGCGLDGECSALDFTYLEGFDTISTVTGDKIRARIGRIDEMTFTINVSGYHQEGIFSETYEAAVHLSEDGAISAGDPYSWWDDRENIHYDELPDEFKEYYARQRGE